MRMIPLSYKRALAVDDAFDSASRVDHQLLGGGTNLIDLMRKGVERPAALTDVTGLSSAIETMEDGGLRIGAAARNSAVAAVAHGVWAA